MAHRVGAAPKANEMTGHVCTSSTRPPGHSGQLVFETDTSMIAGYTGSAWKHIAPAGGVASDAWYTASGTQTVATGSYVRGAFGTATATSPLVTRTASSPGHLFTLGRAGRWFVSCTMRWQADTGAGDREIGLWAGPAGYWLATAQIAKPSATNTPTTLHVCADFTVGTAEAGTFSVSPYAYQTSGSNKVLDGGPGWKTIRLSWIGP